jgi:hypothetical protein
MRLFIAYSAQHFIQSFSTIAFCLLFSLFLRRQALKNSPDHSLKCVINSNSSSSPVELIVFQESVEIVIGF